MDIPSKASLIKSMLQRPAVTIPSQRYNHDEDIPWMSWAVHLCWTHHDDYPQDFLARQPELRAALLAEHETLSAASILAPHGAHPDRVHWVSELVEIQQERWEQVRQTYKKTSLARQPVEQLWELCAVFGRLDEDTTTCAHHLLMKTPEQLVYIYLYQETLH